MTFHCHGQADSTEPPKTSNILANLQNPSSGISSLTLIKGDASRYQMRGMLEIILQLKRRCWRKFSNALSIRRSEGGGEAFGSFFLLKRVNLTKR